MDKMAIFVEGQTEQEFAKELVYAIAGAHHVHIDTVKGYGGARYPRQFLEVNASRPDPRKDYYVLIYDCATDSRVLPDIIEQYDGLVSQRYREILAIRDVFPQLPADIPTIRSDFIALAPSSSIAPLLVLAVMEMEAWFLAEHSHFPKLHHSLTNAAILAVLGYDPGVHDVQLIAHPAADLKRAYDIAGLGYNKSRAHVQRTVTVLDYALFYLDLVARLPDLHALVRRIDQFLS
jgi:hypothetical protein